MAIFNNNNYIVLLKTLLPRIPMILKTLVLNRLHLSSASAKQDSRTELTVAIIRSLINYSTPLSIGKQQRRSMRDQGIKGPMWVSKVCLPAPEDESEDVKVAVIEAINALKVSGEEDFEIPQVVPVEAEWTGYRRSISRDVDKGTDSLPDDMSEEEKYWELKKDSPANMVILYFHGGAFFLMDPSTHRVPVSYLSKLTGAPVLSVRYRLAPQHPFPAALLDALVAYLSLIAPPPGSLHAPVPPEKIVLAGDSSGGNLCLSLLQTLLTLRRINAPTVLFHGKEVSIQLPAGVATVSPWCDVTRSLPSVHANAMLDYIPPPHDAYGHRSAAGDHHPPYPPLPMQPDNIWPCSPPRVDLYSNASAVAHPLVSPLAARKELWENAPPVFIAMGEESLSDEGLITARKVHQAGGAVAVEQFEGMPHCFALLMLGAPAARRCFRGWATFCRDAVARQVDRIRTGHVSFIKRKLLSTIQIPFDEVHPLRDDEVEMLMQENMKRRVEGEKALRDQWRQRAKL
ncbi:hypothetical protein Egran_04170 [Elaphomyces granulatus]|uniref:Alpha/beta hydrolase fold-3 domain-containing protein n=1 Tax=Elaphomyces granulatus TaxID=519963 RepID=A0A232LW79_9EURO|nr:hypothetical protein Egran_04170 [Elaphomyces granulatus]